MPGSDAIRPAARRAWQGALALAVVAGSLAAACMLPFVALATLAAATMSRRDALVSVGAIWAANQLIGFTLLGYPRTADAAAWGAALAVAALAATLIARAVLRGRADFAAAPLLAAFAAAFVGYEALLFGFALVAGGLETFAPAIVGRILVNDLSWFAGLALLHIVLTRAAPRWFGPAPALRLA